MKYFLSAVLFYTIIKPLSLLPFSAIYLISDFVAFLLEHIVAYRKEVILNNLINAFPDKNLLELKKIRTKFYKHFADLIFEVLKGLSVSEKEMSKRVVFENLTDFNRFYKEGRDVLLVLGHYGNWEIAASRLPKIVSHNILGIYKPLSNVFFDNKMKETRSKFGLDLVPIKKTNIRMREKIGRPKSAAFLTDQRPGNPNRCYWTTFLNQETGVLIGAEKFARVFDMPVVYASVYKEKRGHYKVVFETLFEFPKETERGEITEKHTKKLESDIIKHPHLWLWSHKRWKHKKPETMK